MSLSATLFGRDSLIFKATNVLGLGIPGFLDRKFGVPDPVDPVANTDFQTSTYGVPLPRHYGTVPAVGNIFWLEGGKLRAVTKKKKQGGKGGGGQTVKTIEYFATFAVALADTSKTGPIAGIRRIWIGPNLWYNAGSNDLQTIIAGNQNTGGSLTGPLSGIASLTSKFGFGGDKCRVYLGTDDQEPDPRMQADIGVDNCPAYRNTAYIVFYDFPLSEKYGGSLQAAQVKAELVTDQNGTGLRLYDVATQNSIVLNDTATIASMSGGIFSFSADPADPRPQAGDFTNFKKYRYSLTQEKFISVADDDKSYTAPNLETFNYPIGIAGDWSWSYHFSSSPDAARIAGSSTEGDSIILAPYIGESVISFGSYVVDSLLYVFRKRVDGSCYYEIYNGNSLSSTGEILNSDGTPYTEEIGNYTYHIDAGGTPIVEVGGQALWIVSAVSPRVSVFLLSDNGDFNFIEGINFSFGTNQVWGAAADGVLSVAYRSTIASFVRSVVSSSVLPELADIVTQELLLSSLIETSDIEASELIDIVRGYSIASGSIRNGIAPLQGAYPFDLIPSGYTIKGVPRGQDPVATINLSELGAVAGYGMADVILDQPREMDTQLPREVFVKYLDPDRDYDTNEQSWARSSTDSVNVERLTFNISLFADEARGIAQVICFVRWLERNDYSFTLPPIYSDIEPADVITISTPYAQFSVRLAEINNRADGVRECKAKPNAPALYAANAVGGQGVIPDGEMTFPSEMVLFLADIPLIRDIDNEPGFGAAVAGYSDNWPGGFIFESNDNEQTYTDIQSASAPVTMGTARNALGTDDGTNTDFVGALQIDLIAGSLESITSDQFYTSLQWCAYGDDQRWELIRFQNAAIQLDGSYILTTLARGCRGTEWATGLHLVGDKFIFLDDADMLFIGSSTASIGIQKYYKAATFGRTIDEVSSQSFTYRGVNLKPLSPVYLTASNVGGDWSVDASRRSRLSSSWWTSGVEPPLGEGHELYEMDILNGGVVVRTIQSSTLPIPYNASQQAEDFGSIVSSLEVNLYQISDIVGRGYPANKTFSTTVSNLTYLLLRMNGANASTTFTDSSPYARTATASGNAQITTAEYYWGGSSGAFDGTGDYLTIAHNAVFHPSGAFTIAVMLRPLILNSTKTIVSKRATGTPTIGWSFYTDTGGKLGFIAWDGSGNTVVTMLSTDALVNGSWQHVAVSRDAGGVWRLFVRGNKQAQIAESAPIGSNSQSVLVGRDPTTAARDFNGNMNGLIIIGATLYTEDFIPPVAPY
jgi:hypothetical protein